jgi:subtilisin-like proprotein convertase family protein
MKWNFSQRVARLARLFRYLSASRLVRRPRFRPTLEGLEERALLSTLNILNLDHPPGMTNLSVSGGAAVSGKPAANPGAMTTARPASMAASSPMVLHATDVPQPVDYLDVYTTSFVDVPQSLTIASLKVQLNITYPLDNDLTIDLIAPDGTDVPLSSFEGSGANFQNTTFDDGAATPIGAGNSPFAGSYQPEGSLSRLAGMNAQGTWELQIIDWGASSGTLNSWSLIVQPAGTPAPVTSSLAVSGFPSSTTAGQAGSFTVTARDANGNVATGYTGTVHFTSSDQLAGLPADYAFTPADAGSHTFNATLKTAGTQSLTVTDTAAGGLTGTETGIAVSPAAASRLVVGAPATATAGTAFSVTVTAKDAYGNIATGYTGPIHFTSSDGQAVLPADSTLHNGTGTFTVTLQTAGSESLTVTDSATGNVTGSATGSVVAPVQATRLSLSAPSGTTAGSPFSITVTALDANGNTVTGYTGTVQLTSSDGQASLPALYTFTAADHGTHTFSGLVLDTAGTQTVTARDTVSSSITGTGSVAVSPAAASRLVGSGFPSATTAGTAGNITVTARDAFGNVATGYTGTVYFTSSDAQAGLPAYYTFTAADAGSHTFSATLKTAGTQWLAAGDTVNSSLTGTEGGIAVSPAAASRLVVSAPATATAGTAFGVTVTARDAYGNTATGYTGTVHLTSTDGQAVLPVNSTLPNGTGTFSVTLATAGSQTLTATDTAGSTLTGNATVSVSPAASGALVFRSADTPKAFNSANVFAFSVINVPQSVTIGSVKVQVNITYPRDSDLRIDLEYIDNNGYLRSFLVLSDFVGNGGNFQNTIFDDAAATPIAAGIPPFAGSYRPSNPLSALAGHNAQGTWVLEVGDFVGGSGTINSWSLIIQPAGSPNGAAGTAAQHVATPLLANAPHPSPAPADGLPTAGLAMAGRPNLAAGNNVAVSQANALVASPPAVSDVPRLAAFDPGQSVSGTGRRAQRNVVSDSLGTGDGTVQEG